MAILLDTDNNQPLAIARNDIPYLLNLIKEEFSYYIPLPESYEDNCRDSLAIFINMSYSSIYTNIKWLWKHAESKTTPYDILLGACRTVLEAEANLYYILKSDNPHKLSDIFLKSLDEIATCSDVYDFERKMSAPKICDIAKLDDSSSTDRIKSLLSAPFATFPSWAFYNCNFFIHSSAYGMHLAAFFRDNPKEKALPLLLTYDLVRIFPCVFSKQKEYQNLATAANLVMLGLMGIYVARDPSLRKYYEKIWRKAYKS